LQQQKAEKRSEPTEMNENRELYMDALYIMFYGGVTMMAVVACIYLFFRRANAIAPEVKPPLHLRRWVGAFFALMAVGHVWWLLLSYYNILGDLWMSTAVAVTLDCLTLVPVMLAMQLAMLQDRRRPLWPLAVAMVPVAVILGVVIALRDEGILSCLRVYFLLLGITFTLYMVYAEYVEQSMVSIDFAIAILIVRVGERLHRMA
jgi:hypothetical protein